MSIAARMNIAFPAQTRITRRKRSHLPAVPTLLRRRTSLRPPLTDDGNSLHSHRAPGYRPRESETGHLAFSRLGSDALWRSLLVLHLPAHRRGARILAAWFAHCGDRFWQYAAPHRFVGDGHSRVGVAEDAEVQSIHVVHARHDRLRCDFLGRQADLRVAAE